MRTIRGSISKVLIASGLVLAAACSSEPVAPVSVDAGTPSLTTATTESTLLIDTGPGDNSTGTVLDNFSALDYQFLAGKFTLASDSKIDAVAGWMRVFLAGSIDVHIRANNAGNPGADIHTQNYSVPAGATFDWTNFSGYNVTLAAGTYWVSLEPVRGGGFFASMPHGAATPLADYRFLGNVSLGAWSDAFGSSGSNYGFRISGSLVTTETLIGDLSSFLSSISIPQGNAQSINSKLQLALDALAANNTPLACSYLQDVINYTKAQSGKKIPVATAGQIIAQTNAIRAKAGC